MSVVIQGNTIVQGSVIISNPPLLNVYPNAAAAYSVRLLNSSYTGACIRVRRSSDNTEQDIGFTFDGVLNEAALLSFVGAGSGFVTTWYDQSGNNRNATQTTSASQPRIVNAGVIDKASSKIGVLFDGSNDFMLFNGTSAVRFSTNNFTLYTTINSVSNTSTRTYIDGRPSATDTPFAWETVSGQPSWFIQIGNIKTSATTLNNNVWYKNAVTRLSGTLNMYSNSTNILTSADNTNYSVAGQASNRIGAGLSNINYINSYVSDVIIWNGSGFTNQQIQNIDNLLP